MRVGVTGSTGLIGSALVATLREGGHEVHPLIRPGQAAEPPAVTWDPTSGDLPAALDGVDAVVHLAGESITGRWTADKKAAIATSRVQGTKNLCDGLVKLANKPKVLVAASAVGYYGDRGDEKLSEDSSPGNLFLSTVAKAWEGATASAAQAGIRVVNLRIGVVLSSKGGALAEMLTPFRLGVGGQLGSGDQWMSWIALDDLVQVISFALDSTKLSGAVNAVAPAAVTNREFTRSLGKALHRPAILPVPAFAIRTIFGEMGKELLLASTRVVPTKLSDAGFEFRHPELESALAAALESG